VAGVASQGRDELVETHLDLVKRAAASIYPRVSGHVELDELIALGNAGLVEAAQRFDPTRGIPFRQFAWYRVQGAIVDGLRRATTLPRRVWSRLVALRAASDYLEQRGEREVGARDHGGEATDAAATLSKLHDAIRAVRTMYVVSLEAQREAGLDVAAPGHDPSEAIDTRRLGRRLVDAIAQLPDKQRELMTKHYWEGKNLLEAGAELGISKSWASRLHAQAVERLREMIGDDS
jgi:RNA polymerase sigma factor for flagellar operon FliA